MSFARHDVLEDRFMLPQLPRWVTAGRVRTSDDVAFRLGAALALLDPLVTEPRFGVPVRLLGNRLALDAAVVMSRVEGRMATVADLRDAYYLTPPGEARGPDGDALAFWREAVAGRAVADLTGDVVDVPEVLRQADGLAPLSGCVAVMRAVLTVDDQAERVACLLADVVLARAMRWKVVLPLVAQEMTPAILQGVGRGDDLAAQRAVLEGVVGAVGLARDLAGRAAALRAVSPKLRAKGSDAAVALFLAEDAVAPSGMLAPFVKGTTVPMTDRAARRLCDRLVALGVVQELTGRSTFRLYGVAP